MAIQYIGDGNPSGTCLGTATTDLLGFFGTTPIVKPTVTAPATTATTATNEAAIVSTNAALVALGLIVTA